MIKTQIKRKLNKKMMESLKKKILGIDNQFSEIGYFKGMMHKKANMPYANLLYIHAHGLVDGAPVRDVMAHLRPMIYGSDEEAKKILSLLKQYFKEKITINQVFSTIGQTYQDKGKAIFGNPVYLTATQSNPTPLIDTSELKDHFAYRTSLKMEIVTR